MIRPISPTSTATKTSSLAAASSEHEAAGRTSVRTAAGSGCIAVATGRGCIAVAAQHPLASTNPLAVPLQLLIDANCSFS